MRPTLKPQGSYTADSTDKMGKLIDRFNKKSAVAVREVYNYSPDDPENDAKLLSELTERFVKLQNYLKPYFGLAIDNVVRDDEDEPRPYVHVHLVPATARSLQLQEVARRHRIQKGLPMIEFPLTVFFYFEPPLADHKNPETRAKVQEEEQ